MRELEQRYADTLAVVGVHSGKFLAERETPRIREAALRFDIAHPVVNDRQFRVWRAFAVRAWPTLVVIDPEGYVVGMHAGEFTADGVASTIDRLLDSARERGTLAPRPLDHGRETPAVTPGILRYPQKVAVAAPDARGVRRMAVSDTGHHRVLVGALSADGRRLRVERAIGDGTRGWQDDADPARARFDEPQGLLFDGDESPRLHVADAGSHTVRTVDLATGATRTLAGTGHQLRTERDLAAGVMSSPWELARVGDTLYVAMAGIHQLWAVDRATGATRVHAGTFGEDIVDGPLQTALLAQPMAIAAGDGALWFADAESSAVRRADLDPRGSVTTVVGTGLFDFGDRDGAGDTVRLEHPQGLVRHPDGRLLVADSYNDALKWIDPATRSATTWLRDFHEPAGLAMSDGMVWVADTNAHRIVWVTESGERGEVEIAP